MSTFFGINEYSIDGKGRMSLPPRFRAALKKEKGSGFIVTTGPENCLYLFLPSQWEAIIAGDMPALKGADKEATRAFRRYFFGNAAECAPDGMGRILIIPAHRAHARLAKKTVLVGVGNKAEIWDAQLWNKYRNLAIAPRAKEFARIYDV